MTANETESLLFIDDVTADRSAEINFKVFRVILSAQIYSNAVKHIGGRFTVYINKDSNIPKSNPMTS